MSKLKYIFISGGVISGIGKGITSASVAYLLQSSGYRVTPVKFEGYLNIDAGTINPIEHGDPFLCEDGTETDMDIGTYEKFLGRNMNKDNFVTMGQVYRDIIAKERRFEYNGEDVEAVHISNEIIEKIQKVGKNQNAEIVLIELGGTAGEYWNVFFYEASRILTLRYPGDVIHIHVSYVPTPEHLGEPKTKPTQLSVRTLNSMGVQPDFIVARSNTYIDQRRRDRFALFCNVRGEDIISNPDCKSVYEVPFILYKQEFDKKIVRKLGLVYKEPNLERIKTLVSSIKREKKIKKEIVIVGKYFGTGEYQLKDSYAALFDAIDHASWKEGVEVTTKWIDAEQIEKKGVEIMGNPDGIIVPIGWGKRGSEGMIAAANFARVQKIPFFGLCYGMQLAVVAFARNVLGWTDANTTENDLKTAHPVIHLIPDQEKILQARSYGGSMRLGGWDAVIKRNTKAWEIYKTTLINERHRHRWEFNNAYTRDFEDKGLIISARSKIENLVEIIELPKSVHPFYMGTQGHPEYKSSPWKPHPLFLAFINAMI
ncbi:MAG: CTP synthase [Patescibacteria group bacterium]